MAITNVLVAQAVSSGFPCLSLWGKSDIQTHVFWDTVVSKHLCKDNHKNDTGCGEFIKSINWKKGKLKNNQWRLILGVTPGFWQVCDEVIWTLWDHWQQGMVKGPGGQKKVVLKGRTGHRFIFPQIGITTRSYFVQLISGCLKLREAQTNWICLDLGILCCMQYCYRLVLWILNAPLCIYIYCINEIMYFLCLVLINKFKWTPTL